MLSRAMFKALGIGAVVVQYGCIAHCALEFVADFVVVSKYTCPFYPAALKAPGYCRTPSGRAGGRAGGRAAGGRADKPR